MIKMDYSLLSPQQLAKVFTSVPSRALNMFAGMFSDSTIVAVANYLSPEFIASIAPQLPMRDVVRIIPQLDKNLAAEVFTHTPQDFNENIIISLPPNYVIEMFDIVPREFNITTFNNFSDGKLNGIRHLFPHIEEHFPELSYRVNQMKRSCPCKQPSPSPSPLHSQLQSHSYEDENGSEHNGDMGESNILRIRF